MRKLAFAALMIITLALLAGCGGGNSSATLITSSDASFSTAGDVSGQTFYEASTSSDTPITYTFDSGTTSGTTTSGTGTVGGLSSAWSFDSTTKVLTLTYGTNTMTLKRYQTETGYWLVYDTSNSNRLFRLYSSSYSTDATAYLTAIFKTASTYLLGGTIQGADISSALATVSTIAGSDQNLTPPAYSSSATTGTSARFNHPTGITSDKNGNLYIADTANHVIRKIANDADRTVSTIAGTGSAGSSNNDTGTSATFYSPEGITCDGTYLYVSDTGNGTIRRISLTSPHAVTTFAGVAGTHGAVDHTTATSANFYSPSGITTDGTNLYVTDVAYHTIRKIVISTGVVTTLAGYPNSAGSADGTTTSARFSVPTRITTDGTNLYVTDWGNHTIRKIVIATGVVTTIAGNPGATPEMLNGTGTAARFYYPSGITTDGTNLYISEFNDTYQSNPVFVNVIRKMELSSGVITTLAGGSSSTMDSVDDTLLAARFSKPLDIVSDGTNLFVTNYSRGYSDYGMTFPSYNNIRRIGP